MNISSNLLDLNSKTPAFSIVNEGKNVTEVLDKRLMSLSLTHDAGRLLPWRWAGKASHFFQRAVSQWMRLNTLAHRTD